MLKIIFDFDGTLTNSEIPSYSFLKKCGFPTKSKELLNVILKYAEDNNQNIYNAFFNMILVALKDNNISFDDSVICDGADKIKYNPGVSKFLKYFAEDAEYYIITSGYQNYIHHTTINKYFKNVYGSTVDYESDGSIKIKEVITDDIKIKKIDMIAGNNFDNVVYIGDGLTDIPAFKYVSDKGGVSILVNNNDKVYEEIIKKNIKVYHFKQDFKEDSPVFNFIEDLVYFERCLRFIKFKHGSQKRKQGTPYYTHPLAVALMLRDKGFSIEYQVAGLFHDLLEDTETSNEEIFNMSDDEILNATILVTKEKGYNMKDYITRICNNDMARMVKLADRIHNIKETEETSKGFQKKYYKESSEWYTVLAKGTVFEEDLNRELEIMKDRIQK